MTLYKRVSTPSASATRRAPISMPVLNQDLETHLEEQERAIIEKALNETRWNKTAAAKRLGITFRALRYKLKKLDLD